MKLTGIAPQSWFFYESTWKAQMDSTLRRTIICKAEEIYLTPAHKSPHVLLTAIGVLNAEYGKHLTWVDVEGRVKFLEMRYNTFKKITRLPETHGNLEKNCITVDETIWRKIFKENIFAQAYCYHEEPEYCCLFGPNIVKTEGGSSIIVISDSTQVEGQSEESEFPFYTSSSEEEVTSPMVAVGSKLRRKLFDVDPHSFKKNGLDYVNWNDIAPKLKYLEHNSVIEAQQQRRWKVQGCW